MAPFENGTVGRLKSTGILFFDDITHLHSWRHFNRLQDFLQLDVLPGLVLADRNDAHSPMQVR